MTPAEKTIRSYLKKKNRQILAARLFRQLLLPCTLLALLLPLFSGIFHWFPFTVIPLLMDAAVIVTAVSIFVIGTRLVFFTRPTLLITAQQLDRELSTSISHPLISIAHEFSSGKCTNSTNGFSDEVYTRALEHISLHRKLSVPGRSKTGLLTQSGIILGTLMFLLIFPPSLVSYWRLPLRFFTKNTFLIDPGTVTVPKNASVTLTMIDSSGQIPSTRLSLFYPENHTVSTHHLRAEADGHLSFTLDSLTRSVIYRFNAGTFTSPPETISVVPPPYLTSLSVTLTPPAYTGLQASTLPSGQGDCIVYAGTHITFSLTSPGLDNGVLVFNNDTLSMTHSDSAAHCSLTVDADARYHFSLIDTFGQRSDSIGRFSIQIIPDESPLVRFLRPGRNKILEPAQVETLFVEAADDIGIRRTSLFWFRGNDRNPTVSRINLSPPSPVKVWQKSFVWKINRLSLYPGDTLYYWAVAQDGSPRKGNHTTVTDTFWFRIPTFAEMHKTMAERESHTQDLLSNANERNRNLKEKIRQLRNATSRQKGDSTTWEQKEMAGRISETLKEQADTLREALRELEKNAQKLKDEGVLNDELSRKMDEIRKAVEELVKQYGDSLLFPKKDPGDLSLSEMKEAVNKLQQMLPDLEKRLDNTLKYLEALKKDRELATLAMRAQKLAEEQATLAQNPDAGDAADHQNDLLDRTQQLKEDLSKTLSSDKQLNSEDLFRDVDAAAASLQDELSSQSPPSPSSMNQMSASLAALSENLRKQTSDYRREQLEALRKGLLDLSDNSIELAAWQEQIREENPEDEKSRQQRALDQQALTEAAGNLQEKLEKLPALPPALARQLSNSLQSSREAAHAGVQSLGAGSGQFAMNIAAQTFRQSANDLMAVVEMMENQNQGSCQSGAGGMKESLRKMAGKQAAINAATAELLKQLLSGRNASKPGNEGQTRKGNGAATRQAREAARRQQQELAEELKKLAEKFGDGNGGSAGKQLENLEKEAKTLASMLKSPNEEVTERQDRFLARMLQAALSLHREEQGKEERESRSAATIFTLQSAPLPDASAAGNDAFHELRRKALQHKNFPPSYRTSINAYFDSLGVLFLR